MGNQGSAGEKKKVSEIEQRVDEDPYRGEMGVEAEE